MITLAVLTIGLLGSCSKINERLDNLEKKVDGLENEKIASIENQITGINSSIADLGTIRSNIQSLTDEAKSQGEDITDLQAADKALGERINDLNKYVNDTLKATKEWVKATFSTLEQYEKTCDTIAKIDARIGDLDANLSKKITDCVDSLKKWVNVQFEAYYTAAQMDAKLAKMKVELDSAKGRGIIVDSKSDSLAAELTKTKADIDTAKAHITREYTEAIKSAIEVSEGNLTKALQDSIATVNETVTALTDRVVNLETEVISLTGRVTELEKIVQSITFIPEYQGGAVIRIPFGKNFAGDWTLDYEVSGYDGNRDDVAQMIANAFWHDHGTLSIDFKSTEILHETKAAYPGDTLKVKSVRKKFGEKNVISVTVDSLSLYNTIVGHHIDFEDRGMSIRLRLRTGKTDILSDYADVSVKRDSLAYYAALLPYYLNFIYGTEEWYFLTELATDEMTWATGADRGMQKIDSIPVIPAFSWPLEKVWNVAYSAINLSNLIIAEGANNGLAPATIAEAKFYKAFWYFNLVRLFDGVPYVEEYDEHIFYHLKERKTAGEIFEYIIEEAGAAIADLPDNPAVDGGASKTAARLLCGQACLSYGWWLENPNNIPTFPEVASPRGSAIDYFKKAQEILKSSIEDAVKPYELQLNYYDAYTNPDKDYNNSEWILYADHRHDAKALLLPSYGVRLGDPDNVTGRLMNWNWDRLRFDRKQVMFPAADIRHGFPRNIYAPTGEAMNFFFGSENDSRWDATFNSELKGNWGSPATVKYDGFTFESGKTLIHMLPSDYDASGVQYNTGVPVLGKLNGHDNYVVGASEIQRDCYPTLAKYNFKEGDNDRYSRRPSLVMSFGEAYLLYAEACVKLGNNDPAYNSVKTLRKRAGIWSYDYNQDIQLMDDHSPEMEASTSSTITVDYILDERLREFFGSGFRWFDLKRTQKWVERSFVYHIQPSGGSSSFQEVKRDIKPQAYIRFIPQAQVNRTHIQQSIIK